jgi:hypothetical protein
MGLKDDVNHVPSLQSRSTAAGIQGNTQTLDSRLRGITSDLASVVCSLSRLTIDPARTSFEFVTPAKASVQSTHWIPAAAGMTNQYVFGPVQ